MLMNTVRHKWHFDARAARASRSWCATSPESLRIVSFLKIDWHAMHNVLGVSSSVVCDVDVVAAAIPAAAVAVVIVVVVVAVALISAPRTTLFPLSTSGRVVDVVLFFRNPTDRPDTG